MTQKRQGVEVTRQGEDFRAKICLKFFELYVRLCLALWGREMVSAGLI